MWTVGALNPPDVGVFCLKHEDFFGLALMSGFVLGKLPSWETGKSSTLPSFLKVLIWEGNTHGRGRESLTQLVSVGTEGREEESPRTGGELSFWFKVFWDPKLWASFRHK